MVISSTTNLAIKSFTLLTQDFLSLIKSFLNYFFPFPIQAQFAKVLPESMVSVTD